MFILFGIFKEIHTVTKFEVRHGLTDKLNGEPIGRRRKSGSQ